MWQGGRVQRARVGGDRWSGRGSAEDSSQLDKPAEGCRSQQNVRCDAPIRWNIRKDTTRSVTRNARQLN
jgi:hypothetical protein